MAQALHSACYAPHSALYFRPDGLVQACCATGFVVGSVLGEDRPSLREIWRGAALQSQRQALESDSYAFGCQECELAEASGGRQASLAYHFDRFAPGAPHVYPKLLDLALSSRCNLQCVMCNGSLSSAIRTGREGLPPLPAAYDDRFFDELDEFLPHVERLQFKGGEPFLARENRRIWDRLIELGHTPEVTVTTNGTLFNENVERYVRELRMHPNVSVDGMQAGTLESIRVGVDARRLWHNIDRFQELAEVAGNGMTLSFCLVPSNWREVLPFLLEADRRRVNCNVIFVNQPPQFDLLRLPSAELDEVHRDLAGRAARFSTTEPARVWDEVLERIRAQVEHPVELVVRCPRPQPAALDRDQQQELLASLAALGGGEPLVVDAVDAIVTEVHVPAWAAWLRAEGWPGHDIDDLGNVIDREVGTQRSLVVPPMSDGVIALTIHVDAPEGRRSVRVHLFIDAETSQRRCFMVREPGRRSAD